MKRKSLLVAVGVIACSAAGAVMAWAFWTGGAVGSGAAASGALNAPTSVTATVPNPSVRTVHVTWAIPATPDNSAPSGFTVSRFNGTTSAACGTGSAALPGTSTTCDDTNVASGTYTYTVTMQWKSWTSTSSASASVTVAASSFNGFTVSPSTSTPTAGAQFSVTLTALDQYGATLTTYSGTKTVAWSGLSTSPAPTSQAPSYPATSVAFTSGASTTTLTATAYAAGANTLTATESAKSGSAAVAVSAASASKFSVPSATRTAGTVFSVTVTAHDAYDNVATYTGNKTLLWSGPGTAPNGTAPSYPANPVSFSAGSATVNVTLYKAESPTQTVSDGVFSGTSSSFTVNPGASSNVAFTTQPGGGTGGTAWAAQPVVKVRDAYNNVATGDSSNVTLAIGTNPSSGTLSGTKTVAAAAGVATFSGLSIDKAGVGYTLTAADGALTSATSSGFTITVGAAAKLAFTQQPSNGTGGTAWATQPKVTVQDAGGNTVTTSVAGITLAIGTNPGSGTLTCTTNPVTAVAGVATFTGCKIDKAANGYTLTAASGTLTSATSNTFNVTVGAAAKLAFATQPGGAAKAVVWAVQPVVTVQDAGGNTVTSSSASITLAIGTNPPGNGNLSCTTNPLAASSGVASFSGCSISKSGVGYTLTASATGLTGATSAAFTIS